MFNVSVAYYICVMIDLPAVPADHAAHAAAVDEGDPPEPHAHAVTVIVGTVPVR